VCLDISSRCLCVGTGTSYQFPFIPEEKK